MKTKINSFKPNINNLLLLDWVLRNAIRNAYRNRNNGAIPTLKKWNRDEVHMAVRAYRMVKATEINHV